MMTTIWTHSCVTALILNSRRQPPSQTVSNNRSLHWHHQHQRKSAKDPSKELSLLPNGPQMMLKARGHDRSLSQQLLEILRVIPQLILLPLVWLITLSSLTQPVNTNSTTYESSWMRGSEWRRIHGIHKQEFYYKWFCCRVVVALNGVDANVTWLCGSVELKTENIRCWR